MVELPPELLGAVADPMGGRLALIVGAGCSVEEPTSLPGARSCSLDAYRRLIADGVLQGGDCAEPQDLSRLAEAVWTKSGDQAPLVSRLPIDKFKTATPNDGYLIAAALLREHAVIALLTLNFDLAMFHALAFVGADDVSVVMGPRQHDQLRAVNVIWLHGDANAQPNDWILRVSELEEAWKGAWQELVTIHVAVVPVVVFAGLGSPAAVLTATVGRIRNAIRDKVVIHADPNAKDPANLFAAALALPEQRRLALGWCDFMRRLSSRLVAEQVEALRRADEVPTRAGAAREDATNLLAQFGAFSLLEFGHVRARWLMSPGKYTPMRVVNKPLLADLLQGLALVERLAAASASIVEDGSVELSSEGRVIAYLVPASGGGTVGWSEIEARVSSSGWLRRRWLLGNVVALVAGVQGERPEVAPPSHLVHEPEPQSLVGSSVQFTMLGVDEIRQDEMRLRQILRL